MDYIQLNNNKIDVKQIHNLIVDGTCGACSVFVGTTRDNFDGKKVISLEYEAYDNMALKEMRNICTQLRTRWANLKHIAIYHRLGNVPVGEESVVIAVSSPHRSAALESVSFAIDQLKARVPIWKKEIYEEDLGSEWKENAECLWPQHSKSSLRPFDFSSCEIDQSIDNIPEKLVQIKVNDSELNRRVECFLKRKRDEINLYNVNDFKQELLNDVTFKRSKSIGKTSCARTESFLVKQQQSNGHIRVRRVNNTYGPQVRPNYSLQLKKLMASQTDRNGPTGHNILQNSRLRNIETYMSFSSDENDTILKRIKNIEDKILFLESTSPEYKYFVQFAAEVQKTCVKKKVYMPDKLNKCIMDIKRELEQ